MSGTENQQPAEGKKGPSVRKVIGKLRRDRTGWAIDVEGGERIRVAEVDEANPGAHVDRKREWRLTSKKTGVYAVTVKSLRTPRRSVTARGGGLPGSGKSRRH